VQVIFVRIYEMNLRCSGKPPCAMASLKAMKASFRVHTIRSWRNKDESLEEIEKLHVTVYKEVDQKKVSERIPISWRIL